MELLKGVLGDLGRMHKRQMLLQGINLGQRLAGAACPSGDRPGTLIAPPRLLPAGLIITSALMIWKSLVLFSGSESPVSSAVRRPDRGWPPVHNPARRRLRPPTPQVVVVLSGSMEPGFYRGDILFLYQPRQPVRTGEVVVFNTDGRDIPIVHRIIKVHQRAGNDTQLDILTKVSQQAP